MEKKQGKANKNFVNSRIFNEIFVSHKVNILMLELALLLVIVSFLSFFNELTVFLLQSVAFVLSAAGVLSAMGKDLSERKLLTENNLFSLAIVLALVIGKTPDAVFASVIFEIIRFYKEYNEKIVAISLRSQLNYGDTVVVRLENDAKVSRFADEICVGDLIVVTAGERIFADGVVAQGEGHINISDIFGEKEKVFCKTGDKVLSGSILEDGEIIITAAADYNNSVFTTINENVKKMGKEKSNTEKFLISFAKIFPVAVLSVSVFFGLIVPMLGSHEYNKWIYRAIICIIVAVPYTIVKSISATYISGATDAARRGILFKSSNAVDISADLTSVVFDKTGTLSTGEFTVVGIEPSDGIDDSMLLNFAVCVYTGLETSIAEAVCRYADNVGIKLDERISCERKEEINEGDAVVINDKLTVYAGSAEFMEMLEIDVIRAPDAVSSVFIAAGKHYMGRIDILDSQKQDSGESVDELRKLGVVNIALITEDNTLSATKAGKEIGITEIYADCTAEDKIERIRYLAKLESVSERLAYVCGYPYNPQIMKTADMGVVINGLNTFSKEDISDVVILNDTPSDVAGMIKCAQNISKTINNNILIYIGVKALMLVFALTGIMTLWAAILADSLATFVVLKNSSKFIKFFDIPEKDEEDDFENFVEDVEEEIDGEEAETKATDEEAVAEDEENGEDLSDEESDEEDSAEETIDEETAEEVTENTEKEETADQ